MDARAELIKVIQQVRSRWRTKVFLRGALFVLAGAVLTIVLASSGLQALRFTATAITAFRVAVFVALAALVGFWLLLPLRRTVTDEQVALFIEEQDPSLKEHLISAVELSEARAGRPEVSPALVDRLVRDAVEKCRALEERAIGREMVRRLAVLLGAGIVAATLLLTFGPEFLRNGASALFIITRDAEAAAPFHIGVEPGNAKVPRGSDQTIKAMLRGFTSADVQLFYKTDEEQEFEALPLAPTPGGDAYTGILFDLKKPVTYYVKSNGVTSDTYTMTLVDLPAVDEMELEYVFPAYTGLPPQVVKPGGDVAALRGTEVRLHIKPTMATAGGGIAVDPATGSADLTTGADGTLTGSFKIDKDGFYHVELNAATGERVKASPEYTVDVLADNGPRVSFNKPGRDSHAMSLDEVFLQAKADDDYGVRSMDLYYSVNGGPEKTVNLYSPSGKALSEVTAGHTIYLEELGVKPGDSVSYYAKATDADVVSGPKTGTSDIYFIEVDAFNRNFRQAQSQQQMQGGGGGQQGQRGSMAQQEKEIIAATFNSNRDRAMMGADKFKEALVVIRLQQEKLRGQVTELVTQLAERLQGNAEFKQIADLLVKSIDPMKEAESTLDAQKAKDALTPEQKAYQLLQQAEQKYDVQVGRQQQQGGGGGGGGQDNAMSEDLADLFQMQLDKMANQYETQQRAGQQQSADRKVDEAADKLKELARRQQQEIERQRRAAQQGNRASQGGQGQRELADEMEQMARQLQQLSREQQRTDQQRNDLQSAAQRMQSAADQMRRAAANGQSDGGAQAQTALQQLQEAQRQLQQAQQSRPTRDLQDAVRQTDRLVQQQKDIANDTRSLAQQPAGSAERQQRAQRMADQKAQMSQQVGELQQTLDKLATDTRANERDTSRRVQEAAAALRDQRVQDHIDFTRGTLQNQQSTQQAYEDEIASNLQDVQRKLGEAQAAQGKQAAQSNMQQALGKASDLLRNMQSMRDRMQNGSAAQNAQGSQQQNAQGSQQQNPQGSGQQNPQGSRQQNPQGSGQQNPQGSQQQNPQGSGQQNPQGSQQQNPQGSQQRGQQGQGQQGQGGQRGQQGQGQPGREGQLTGNPAQMGGGGGDSRALNGSYAPGTARQFANEAQQAASDGENLRRALANAGAGKEDLAQLDQVLDGLRKLGQPNAYNDPKVTNELADRAMDKLQTLEFNLRKKVEKNNQLFLNGSDQIPSAFRGSVEEYYRSLAKRGGGAGPAEPKKAPAEIKKGPGGMDGNS